MELHSSAADSLILDLIKSLFLSIEESITEAVPKPTELVKFFIWIMNMEQHRKVK